MKGEGFWLVALLQTRLITSGRAPKIRIRTRQLSALIGQRLIVAVDEWPLTSQYPLGHYVDSLGPCLELKTEVRTFREISP